MTFKPLTYFLFLSSIALLFSCTDEQDSKLDISLVTDEAELRNITDAYRGNPEREEDFIPQGNGTVIDKRTGLQWMSCSLGQQWTGETCTGQPSKYNWEQANKERSNFAGYSDWRLPTIWELGTLVYCSSGKFEPRDEKHKILQPCKGDYQSPTIVTSAFPNTQRSWYWSSSQVTFTDTMAQAVIFYLGRTYSDYKRQGYYVRLVRNGQ